MEKFRDSISGLELADLVATAAAVALPVAGAVYGATFGPDQLTDFIGADYSPTKFGRVLDHITLGFGCMILGVEAAVFLSAAYWGIRLERYPSE
ncbi:MAG TPA: hypothetical protein VJK52_05520 [Candidatus Nanoarchaeia archaeon]|nr:hypothetical protein [Candidatus Nanoarchaeia archaeon]